MSEPEQTTEEPVIPVELNPPLDRVEYLKLLEARDGKAGWITKTIEVPDSAEITKKSAAEIAVFLSQLITSGTVLALNMTVGQPVRIKYKVPNTGTRLDKEYLEEAARVATKPEAQASLLVPDNLSQLTVGDYFNVITRLASLVLAGDPNAQKYAQQALDVLKTQSDNKVATKPTPSLGGAVPPTPGWFPGEETDV